MSHCAGENCSCWARHRRHSDKPERPPSAYRLHSSHGQLHTKPCCVTLETHGSPFMSLAAISMTSTLHIQYTLVLCCSPWLGAFTLFARPHPSQIIACFDRACQVLFTHVGRLQRTMPSTNNAVIVQANAVSFSAELPRIDGGTQKVLYPSSAKAGSDLQVGCCREPHAVWHDELDSLSICVCLLLPHLLQL